MYRRVGCNGDQSCWNPVLSRGPTHGLYVPKKKQSYKGDGKKMVKNSSKKFSHAGR